MYDRLYTPYTTLISKFVQISAFKMFWSIVLQKYPLNSQNHCCHSSMCLHIDGTFIHILKVTRDVGTDAVYTITDADFTDQSMDGTHDSSSRNATCILEDYTPVVLAFVFATSVGVLKHSVVYLLIRNYLWTSNINQITALNTFLSCLAMASDLN